MKKRKERNIGRHQASRQRLQIKRRKLRAFMSYNKRCEDLVPPSTRVLYRAKSYQMMADAFAFEKAKANTKHKHPRHLRKKAA